MGSVTTIYYVGPSLYATPVDHLPNEVWRGPAKQGDILRDVIEMKPRQIVLIDGVFHMSLAVWQKELIFALLEGVVCIGAASMGALRAAEMHRYGMIPIGKIAQMYVDGEERDDLVAMAYDPDTFRPTSPAPVGQEQKRLDALEAIDFARSHATRPRQPINTLLDRSAISETLKTVIQRILSED